MSGSSQKQSVREHFSHAALSWSARYANDLTFQSYNFIVRRKMVLDLLDKEGGRYLDAGCGTGDFIPALLERGGEVFAVDVAPEMIRQTKAQFFSLENAARLHLSVADVTKLDFPARYFDAVIGVGLIEYLSEDDRALEELYRVLKPGGVLIITVPNLASPFMAFEVLTSRIGQCLRRALARTRGYRVSPGFVHRHFLPWVLDRRLAQVGFHKLDHRFCTYGVFSAPRLGALFLALSRRLERFSRSPFAILGTNYIVKLEKS